MYKKLIDQQTKKLDLLQEMQAEHELKQRSQLIASNMAFYGLGGFFSYFAMMQAQGIYGVFFHLLLNLALHGLMSHAPTWLKVFSLPLFAIAWIAFIGHLCFALTFGLFV